MAASLGVLSTALCAGLARVDGRIDSLGTRLVGRMDTLGAHIDAQGQELRSEIRDLRDTVHGLDVRLTSAGG